jgi:phosphoribosylanthranilate isomerase
MTVSIKICGVTRAADARLAVELGAGLVGINFWPGSKRFVGAETAASIAAEARAAGEVEIVGVFVDPTDAEIAAARGAAGLDWIQLHGSEAPERVAALGPRAFKAVPVSTAADVEAAITAPGELVLLDARVPGRGGAGVSFDWSLAAPMAASGRRWFLAGGLDPDNVAAAITACRPTGVDVASGVESAPGLKSPDKLRAFIEAARAAAP